MSWRGDGGIGDDRWDVLSRIAIFTKILSGSCGWQVLRRDRAPNSLNCRVSKNCGNGSFHGLLLPPGLVLMRFNYSSDSSKLQALLVGPGTTASEAEPSHLSCAVGIVGRLYQTHTYKRTVADGSGIGVGVGVAIAANAVFGACWVIKWALATSGRCPPS